MKDNKLIKSFFDFLNKYSGNRFILDNFIFVVVIIIFVGVSFFMIDNINNIAIKIKEQKTLSEKMVNRVESLSSLQEQYDSIKEAFFKVTSIFPSNNGIAGFLARLDNLSDVVGVSAVSRLGVLEPVQGVNGVSALTVNISFAGDLVALSKYITELEALPYIIRIEDVDISGSEGVSKFSQIKISIKLFIQSS